MATTKTTVVVAVAARWRSRSATIFERSVDNCRHSTYLDVQSAQLDAAERKLTQLVTECREINERNYRAEVSCRRDLAILT